ncbi:MAG: hypothetical protein ACOC44_11245 [Promethearchaeia archaeon]
MSGDVLIFYNYIYYLFKGISYLFYYIGQGIYKLCEALYYTITGKQKKQDPSPTQQPFVHGGVQSGRQRPDKGSYIQNESFTRSVPKERPVQKVVTHDLILNSKNLRK